MPSAASPLRVWVTRAMPGAEATAERLRGLGHEALVAPLIETQALPFTAPDLRGVAALAFTSAVGVRTFAARVPPDDRPVYTVGEATAAAAREAGWTRVASADGDGAALARRILADACTGRVLAPGAAEPAFDLKAALERGGVSVETLPVYATRAVDPPPAAALAALAAGGVGAVLLHAPSATRALDAAAPDPRAGALAICLSAACAPTAAGWRILIAAAPRERDLLALLPPGPALDSAPTRR